MKSAGQDTDAIVLRRYDFSETSQTGRLWTRSDGLLSVIAKGIREPNADLRGPMDAFCHVDIAFRRATTNGGLNTLTRYRVRTGFPALRAALPRVTAAFYITELFAAGTRELDPDERMFELLLGALNALSEAADDCCAAVVIATELAFFALSGFGPGFGACAQCGRVAAPRARARFSPARGGLVCSGCAPADWPGLIPLSAEQRRVLTALGSASPAAAAVMPLPARDAEVFRRVLDRISEQVLERDLRSARFLSGSW